MIHKSSSPDVTIPDVTVPAFVLRHSERLASETGGRYYDADGARRVVDDLAFSREGSTLLERRELWDMPIVFLALAALLAVEWGLRRRWGMA